MAEERVQRRLAAILAGDGVAYSRLMGKNEAGTRARFNAHLNELIVPTIENRRGRIVKTTGDALLVEFASVVDAVECAVEIQKGMSECNADEPDDQRMEFRIGVNLGDVIIEGDDIHGDGVNVASRLEALADPGGILISGAVCAEVAQRLPYRFEDIGEQRVKNIDRPIPAWRVSLDALAAGPGANTPRAATRAERPGIAVLPFANMSGDPDQEYFAAGMVEEFITGLARIRWLTVIARNSTFVYKANPPDVRQVGRDLAVRYVVEGSVRKAGKR